MSVTEKMIYGGAPYAKHSSFSRDAAAAIEKDLPYLERKVYHHLRLFGPLSDQQMQDQLRMDGNTQRPRRRRLVEKGLVAPVGWGRHKTRKVQLWDVVRGPATQTLLALEQEPV